jgi:hypothetical protein
MKKSMALSALLAVSGAQTNSEVMEDQPSIDEGIIFNQGGETHQVSYLDRDFSDDDGKCFFYLHIPLLISFISDISYTDGVINHVFS